MDVCTCLPMYDVRVCKILPESTRCPGLLTKLMYNRYGYPHVAVPPPSAPCRPKSRVSLFRPGVLLHLGGGPFSCMCPIFIFMLQWKGKKRPRPASSWHHGVFASCGGAGAAFYILLSTTCTGWLTPSCPSTRRLRAPMVISITYRSSVPNGRHFSHSTSMGRWGGSSHARLVRSMRGRAVNHGSMVRTYLMYGVCTGGVEDQYIGWGAGAQRQRNGNCIGKQNNNICMVEVRKYVMASILFDDRQPAMALRTSTHKHCLHCLGCMHNRDRHTQ